MANYTEHEIAELTKLGFHWNEVGKEFFSDALDYEMGVYRDMHDNHLVLRSRIWNDDLCEYRDDYEHFENITELVAYF